MANRPRSLLSLRDLVIYGVVLVQPIAPVGIFGISERASRGHVTTTILLAMIAMLFTAYSYGRLAARYPSAGSAYTYVGSSFGPYIGFLVGWAMFLDYLIIPLISTQYAALAVQRLTPEVPLLAWVGLFCVLITWLNLRGIRSMANANRVLLLAMCGVLAAFFILAVCYLLRMHGWHGLVSPAALYNPRTFDSRLVLSATSLAALTYIGFDGVTTMAEDVEDPRRTVPIATVLVCLVVGMLSAAEVYLAHQAWPDFTSFPSVETAFLDVTRRVGGVVLFQAMAAILVAANFGSSLTGQAGAARLLHAMGRGNTLPAGIFGRWDEKRQCPSVNIALVGALAFTGALVIDFERGAALLNFGAFLAFIGVNLATIREFWFRQTGGPHKIWRDIVCPAAGFLSCLGIWVSLPAAAKIAGAVWFAAGIGLLAVRTKGFRRPPAPIRFEEE
jgi:amino acid transporter